MKKLLFPLFLIISLTAQGQLDVYFTADVGYKMLNQTIKNPSVFNKLDQWVGTDIVKDERTLQEDNIFVLVSIQPDFYYGDAKLSYGLGSLRKFLKPVKSASINTYPLSWFRATDGLRIGDIDFTKLIGLGIEYYSDGSLQKFLAKDLAPKQELLMKFKTSVSFNRADVYIEYNKQVGNRRLTPYTFDHVRFGVEMKVYTVKELIEKIF